MNPISKRLRASLAYDAINGDSQERTICALQMKEAAERIEQLERKLAAAREALAFALAKEESDMSDAEQCGGWDDVDWLNAHARANRYRAALTQP